jgi:hypothetical protein
MCDAPGRVPDTGPITFPDVLVLQRTDAGWLCEIQGRRVYKLQVEPGTLVPGEGQRGPVTIAAVPDIQTALSRARR